MDRREVLSSTAATLGAALAAMPAQAGARLPGWRVLHQSEDGRVSLYAGVDSIGGAKWSHLTFWDDYRSPVELPPGRLWFERVAGTDWLGPFAS